MPRPTTTYDILLSCPGDVQEELRILKEVVDDFNRTSGARMGINLSIRHWSTDSFAQTGGEPQKLLNEQFIQNTDAVIGIIWTKLGTPTEEYDSGTVQEILEAYAAGKQVFIYFSDIPVSMSKIDSEQKKKVDDFRKKIEVEKIGMYKSYGSIEEFSKLVTQDLLLYFIKLESEMVSFNSPMTSELKIKSLDSQDDIVENITPQQKMFEKEEYTDSFKKEFRKRVNEISAYDIGEADEKESSEQKTISQTFSLLMEKKYNFPEAFKASIIKCGEIFKIEISDSFFSLGNLKYKSNSASILGSNTANDFVGTKEEKEKKKKLIKLAVSVKKYFETIEYFSQFNKYNLVRLVLCNTGNIFCTKVTVKLTVNSRDLTFISDLDSPGEMIIEKTNESDFYDEYLGSKKTSEVENYPNHFSVPPSSFRNPLQFNGKLRYKSLVEDYEYAIRKLEDFDKYVQGDQYVLVYEFPEIKQHTNISFPSLLLLNKNDSIEVNYSINSKEIPEVIEGKITYLHS